MDRKQLEKLLSLYLDGELSERDRRRARRLMRRRPDAIELYRELRRLRRGLQSLPKLEAPQDVVQTVTNAVAGRAADGAPDAFARELLLEPKFALAAYYDGELNADQRAKVERDLLHQKRYQRRLERLERVCGAMGELPRLTAPAHLVASSLERIKAESPAETIAVARATTSRRVPRRPRWEIGVGIAAAVAFVFAIVGAWRPRPAENLAVAIKPPATGVEASGESSSILAVRVPQTTVTPLISDPVGGAGKGPGGPSPLVSLLGQAGELDGRQIHLSCENVEDALSRFRAILADHQAPLGGIDAARASDPGAVAVDVRVTPATLELILGDMAQAEASRRLIAEVSVESIEPPESAPVVASDEPLNPLAKVSEIPKASSSAKRVPARKRSTDKESIVARRAGRPASARSPIDASAPSLAEIEKMDPTLKSPAARASKVRISRLSTPARPEPAKATTTSTPPTQVRVVFVLEPAARPAP